MLRGLISLLCSLPALAAAAPSRCWQTQEPEPHAAAQTPAQHAPKQEGPAAHRAALRLLPQETLQLALHRTAVPDPTQGKASEHEFVRPAGLPRYVAAVLSCADMPQSAPDLLRLPERELLTVQNAGGDADAGAVEVLVRRQEVQLIFVLSHARCACLHAEGVEPGLEEDRATVAEQRAARRRLAAMAHAKARRLPLERAHAELQREQLLAGSPVLRQAAERGRLLVVTASATAPKGGLVIHAKNRDRQLVPVVDPAQHPAPSAR